MKPLTRRQFIGSSLLAASALTQAPVILAGQQERKIKLGLIGCGWYGMVDLKDAFRAGGVEAIALCDVDSEHLNASAAEVEKLQGYRPRTFKQYEDLFGTPGLEAVIIATPPHWHALQLLAALHKGLDVYCEKPLSYDIREGRAMVEAVRRSGRIVQVGFQRRQSAAFQAVRRHLESGQAGRVICCEANIHYNANPKDSTPQTPPPSLDWDLWCGPAPKIAYSPQVGHMNWRLEKTTGHGHLVDWGIHLVDATRVILGLSMPKSVVAAGGLYALNGKITTPDTLTATFEFDRCPLTWRHRIWGAEEYDPQTSNGIFFYCENQTIFVTDDRWEIIPRGNGKERKVQKASTEAGLLQVTEFLRAVRDRKPPGCLVEDAYVSTATVQLAMISYETENRVNWDAKAERITNNPAGQKLLRREYRKPYKHPY